MTHALPKRFSCRVNCAAARRIRIVTGMAAMVKPNSRFWMLLTMTRNWIVKPRKKKKSNFRRAM
jgi:hypothetical protein